MQNDSKFLGMCLLISSLILSGAIVFHGTAGDSSAAAPSSSSIGRYQFQPSNPPGVIWILDTTTGEVKTRSG